jgi:hypothetical protein
VRQCTYIDGKIAHYQKIIVGIYHRETEQRLKALIEEMQAEKAKLHPILSEAAHRSSF